MRKSILAGLAIAALAAACSPQKMDVILDTDANNEIDDQHAIAYMLLNDDVYNTLGITTNVTIGGTIDDQNAEVERVAKLVCKDDVKILSGATGNFVDISADEPGYDGCDAVEFIIDQARKHSPKSKLTLIPVGKLTNIALALKKAPDIIPNVKIVWLGSNYPEPGEHNLIHDIPSMNYVLDTDAEFEMALVCYGKPIGTDAVRMTIDRVKAEVAGKGPRASKPVVGRHGGEFTCFGDYSLNLFENVERHTDGSRALFDMACVAVAAHPEWVEAVEIPAPTMIDGNWVERPDNAHKIKLLQNFDKEAIVNDFVRTINQ